MYKTFKEVQVKHKLFLLAKLSLQKSIVKTDKTDQIV